VVRRKGITLIQFNGVKLIINMIIHLHNLKFFSHHGIHEEEKILGTAFEVNVEVEIKQNERIDTIHQTIDYVQVYNMVKERMTIATPLLETVLEDLVSEIHQSSTLIKSIAVSIKKINPPIENFSGSVGVSLKKNFSI
jgi:7,8-dihydroneopterin aldolase/epimerase/oxygenase